jgi:hypothetical protein
MELLISLIKKMKSQNNAIYMIYVVIIMIFLSCKPTNYQCNNFENFPWSPYTQNQEVIFKEKNNSQPPAFSIKKLIVSEFSMSEAYDLVDKRSIFYESRNICRSGYWFRDENFNFSISLSASDSAVGKSKRKIIIPLKNIKMDVSLGDLRHVDFKLEGEKVIASDSIGKSINLKYGFKAGVYTYEEVIEIKVDTLLYPNQNYWRIIYAKNYGLVSFTTRNPKEEWIRQ